MAKKPGFFSRITGSADEYDDFFDEPRIDQGTPETEDERPVHLTPRGGNTAQSTEWQQEGPEGTLAVDVYQTPDSIVIKAFIAGIQPNSIEISLTRETLTISGERQDEREVEEDDYFQRELYWGSFSRTILLPEEVDVDMAEASEKHGILMIRLPKVNKARQAKLKVRSR